MGCGGGLGTVLGGAAGFMVGGPAGAALGASMGGSIGGGMDAASAQEDALNAQMGLANAQMAQWNRIYGPVEKNLSDYYTKTTPDQATSLGLQKVQQEWQQQMQKTQQMMAQKGLAGTTPEAQMLSSQQMGLAQARATERIMAPERLRAEKMSFLATGKGTQQNAYSAQQSALQQQSQLAGQQSQSLMGGAGQLAQMGMQYYAMNPNMFNSSNQLPSLGIGGNFTPTNGGAF